MTTIAEQPATKHKLTQEQINQDFATHALSLAIELLVEIGGIDAEDETEAAREAA